MTTNTITSVAPPGIDAFEAFVSGMGPSDLRGFLSDLAGAMRTGEPVTVTLSVGTPADQLLTTSETAVSLGISRPYLYRLLDAGKIPFAYIGTHRRIKRGDIDAYLARRDTATTDLVVRLANASEVSREVRRAAMDEALDKAGWD